jgi:hypothetical protein
MDILQLTTLEDKIISSDAEFVSISKHSCVTDLVSVHFSGICLRQIFYVVLKRKKKIARLEKGKSSQ